MGRRLAGPVKLRNSGESWYARLTVKPAERPLVGRSRLIRSLGTSDHSIALQRWPKAYQALQQELEQRIQKARSGELVRRQEIRERIRLVWDDDQLAPAEVVEIVTGEKLTDPKEASPLFRQAFAAYTKRRELTYTWDELVNLHAETILRRRGEPLSRSWFRTANQAIKRVAEILPEQINRDSIKALTQRLRTDGLSDKTIATQLSILQSVMQTGIEEDVVNLDSNPFRSVRFSAATREEDKYLPFERDQLRRLLTETRDPWVFELLCSTGLRVGELLNRIPDHVQGQMLVIGKTDTWKPKTKSSYRRVPIPEHLVYKLWELLPVSSPGAWEQRLRQQIKDLFNHKQLVTHSCRHTFKSLSRKVGMPTDISDEIDGHKKKDVSAISDHYGHYPDEVLIEWVDVLSKEIQALIA